MTYYYEAGYVHGVRGTHQDMFGRDAMNDWVTDYEDGYEDGAAAATMPFMATTTNLLLALWSCWH